MPRWVTAAVGGVPEVPSTGVSGWGLRGPCHSYFDERFLRAYDVEGLCLEFSNYVTAFIKAPGGLLPTSVGMLGLFAFCVFLNESFIKRRHTCRKMQKL